MEIVSCAIRTSGGAIVSMPKPNRHHNILNESGMRLAGEEQGFLDSTGMFRTREEALTIAKASGQIIKRCCGDDNRLFSENLW